MSAMNTANASHGTLPLSTALPSPAAAVQGPPRRTGGVPLEGEGAQRLRGGFFSLPLYRLAHSRTGDKGNRSNLSVIAWHPALWDVLVQQVTEEAVASHFAARQPSRVARYLLPQLHAMNLVLDDVLDGGVNDALNLDSHGKTLSYWLLSLPVQVPTALADYLAGPAD